MQSKHSPLVATLERSVGRIEGRRGTGESVAVGPRSIQPYFLTVRPPELAISLRRTTDFRVASGQPTRGSSNADFSTASGPPSLHRLSRQRLLKNHKTQTRKQQLNALDYRGLWKNAYRKPLRRVREDPMLLYCSEARYAA
jgi:hypothetical protein